MSSTPAIQQRTQRPAAPSLICKTNTNCLSTRKTCFSTRPLGWQPVSQRKLNSIRSSPLSLCNQQRYEKLFPAQQAVSFLPSTQSTFSQQQSVPQSSNTGCLFGTKTRPSSNNNASPSYASPSPAPSSFTFPTPVLEVQTAVSTTSNASSSIFEKKKEISSVNTSNAAALFRSSTSTANPFGGASYTSSLFGASSSTPNNATSFSSPLPIPQLVYHNNSNNNSSNNKSQLHFLLEMFNEDNILINLFLKKSDCLAPLTVCS